MTRTSEPQTMTCEFEGDAQCSTVAVVMRKKGMLAVKSQLQLPIASTSRHCIWIWLVNYIHLHLHCRVCHTVNNRQEHFAESCLHSWPICGRCMAAGGTHSLICGRMRPHAATCGHMRGMCVTHPLASSAVATAAWGTGVCAEAKNALRRDKYGRTGTGACRFVPLSHETYGRAGPPAFAFLHELAEFAASTGEVSKKIFMENAMRDLSTTLCRSIAWQVLASAPLRERQHGGPVRPGRPVPTDGLA